jgi:hypothetical protein
VDDTITTLRRRCARRSTPSRRAAGGHGGKVSKVQKVSTLAEFCNKGAKYIGTVANLYNG